MKTSQRKETGASVPSGKGTKVEKTITVMAPASQVYAFWRKLENLPRFMNHLESVVETDATHSHWVVKGPAGKSVQWDAEILEDRPNEMLSWRSLPGSEVDNAGSVWFTAMPNNTGTIVKVALKYSPPAGMLGIAIAKLWGEDAETGIEEDLQRLKRLLEGQPRAVAA